MTTVYFFLWVGLVLHGYYRYNNPRTGRDKFMGPIGVLLGGYFFWLWLFWFVLGFYY
jgi:hypothetical protein